MRSAMAAGPGGALQGVIQSHTEVSFYKLAEQAVSAILDREPVFLGQAASLRATARSCGARGLLLHTPLHDGLGLVSFGPRPSFRVMDALEPEHAQYFGSARPKLVVVDRKSQKYITQRCRVVDLETGKTDKEAGLESQYLTAEIVCSPSARVFLAPIMETRPERAAFVKAYDVSTLRCLPVEFGDDPATGLAALHYPSAGRVAEEAKASRAILQEVARAVGGARSGETTHPSRPDLRDSQDAAYAFLAVRKSGELAIGDLRKPKGLIRAGASLPGRIPGAKKIGVSYDNRLVCVWDDGIIECYELSEKLLSMQRIASSPVRMCRSLCPTTYCLANPEQQRIEYLWLMNADTVVFLPSGLAFSIQGCGDARCMCYDKEQGMIIQMNGAGQVFGWRL